MGSVTMSRIGFVTYPEAPDITSDDRLAIAPLAALGYQVEPVIWRDARVGWQDYSAVVLRSCWDYHLDPGAFGGWIERMEREEFDLIAIGRVVITEPNWVELVRDGRFDDIRPFDPKALATFD